MKKTFAIAAFVAAATLLGSAAAGAQGKKGEQGANPPMTKAVNEMGDESVKRIENEEGLQSFASADQPASGKRGFKDTHDRGSCPPAQKKKLGSGGRFQC
jgi:Cu/Zn superoxide dismutase